MGKGKGNVEYWVALIQPGKVLYEMDGVPEELAVKHSARQQRNCRSKPPL